MECDDQDRFAAKTLILTICGAKFAVIGIVIAVSRNTEGLAFALVSTWYWLIPLGFVVGGPLLYRFRLHRARGKRKKLLAEEWEPSLARPPLDAQTVQWLRNHR
jgi:hypothetical protein